MMITTLCIAITRYLLTYTVTHENTIAFSQPFICNHKNTCIDTLFILQTLVIQPSVSVLTLGVFNVIKREARWAWLMGGCG